MKKIVIICIYLSITTMYGQDSNSFSLNTEGLARVFYEEKEFISKKEDSVNLSYCTNYLIFSIESKIEKFELNRDVPINYRKTNDYGIGVLHRVILTDANTKKIEFVFTHEDDSKNFVMKMTRRIL